MINRRSLIAFFAAGAGALADPVGWMTRKPGVYLNGQWCDPDLFVQHTDGAIAAVTCVSIRDGSRRCSSFVLQRTEAASVHDVQLQSLIRFCHRLDDEDGLAEKVEALGPKYLEMMAV